MSTHKIIKTELFISVRYADGAFSKLGHNALKRGGQRLHLTDIGQGLVRVAAAQLRVGLEINANTRPFRPAEQGAQVIACQVHATHARGFAPGHTGDGTGNGDGDAAGAAAGTAVHGSYITKY